jgi:hypothetical protein
VSLETYNVRTCRKFCGSSKKKMKGVLRARTEKFSDEEMPQRQCLKARQGRALGFLETPNKKIKASPCAYLHREVFILLNM